MATAPTRLVTTSCPSNRVMRSAMSASRFDRLSDRVSGTSSTTMPGCFFCRAASAGATIRAASVSTVVSLTTPSRATSLPVMARSAARTSASARSALPSTASPVGVSAYPLGVRCSNRAPIRASIAARRRPIVGWVTPSERAAAESVPCRAIARNVRKSSQSMPYYTKTHSW